MGKIVSLFVIFAILFMDSIANASAPSFALLGDSMTWIGGDSCQNPTGWSYYLKESYPESDIMMFARSGSTWTNTSLTRRDPKGYSEMLDDGNVVFNQALRLISSDYHPDIIIIYAGANDVWFEKERPDIHKKIEVPSGTLVNAEPGLYTSLESSIELSCRLLQESFPEAKILLVTPVEMTKTSVDKINRIGDVIEATGNRLGLTTLRADKKVNIRRNKELGEKKESTTDGVHTNRSGAKKIADFIIPAINEMNF